MPAPFGLPSKPSQTLAAWTQADTNHLVGQRLNNTSNALSSAGGQIVIAAGQINVFYNDKTDVYPNLDAALKGWDVVWRVRDWVSVPTQYVLKIARVDENGAVSAPANASQSYDPVLAVRGTGAALVVYEDVDVPNASRLSLNVILNAGAFGSDPAQSYNWHYVYDGLGRVMRACSNGWNEGTQTCGGSDFRYAYDGAGNLKRFDRFKVTTNSVETVINTYNGANQIATSCVDANKDGSCGAGETVTTYTYDVYGNLTGDGVNTYAYNAANQLTSVINAQGATCSPTPAMATATRSWSGRPALTAWRRCTRSTRQAR